MSESPTRTRLPAWVWPAAVLGFVARVVVGLRMNVDASTGVQRGYDFYGLMAANLRDGRGLGWEFYNSLGFKFANRGPLYPLFIAAARAAGGTASATPVIVAQAALGAAACLVPAMIALRWGGARAAVLAAWIAAAWPYFVVSDTGMIEQVVYAPLVGLAALSAMRAADRASPVAGLLAGALAGLATLARLTFAVSAAFLFAALALRRRRWACAALYAAGTATVLAPWVVRNHAVVGAWTLGTDGGRALWNGNSSEALRGIPEISYPAVSIDVPERKMVGGLFDDGELARLRTMNGDEVAQEAEFRRLAIAEIRDHPHDAAWGLARKSATLWSPVMNPGPATPEKLAIFGLSAAALFVGCVGAASRVPRIRADLPTCAALAGSFTLISAVFWAESRYAAPLHGIAIAALAAWLASFSPDMRRAS